MSFIIAHIFLQNQFPLFQTLKSNCPLPEIPFSRAPLFASGLRLGLACQTLVLVTVIWEKHKSAPRAKVEPLRQAI
jgi:hypothetical protein